MPHAVAGSRGSIKAGTGGAGARVCRAFMGEREDSARQWRHWYLRHRVQVCESSRKLRTLTAIFMQQWAVGVWSPLAAYPAPRAEGILS